mgnify:CR=1 FL=1
MIYKFGYDINGDVLYIEMEQDEELEDSQLYALNCGEWIISGKQLRLLRSYINN